MILASPYTQIFWNEYQINQHRFDYNLVFDNFIEGALDIALLSASLNKLVGDYILLDSHLVCNKGSLFWQKNDSITPLIHLDNDEQVIQKFVQQPFCLDKGPLYRFGFLPLTHNQYRFVMVLHHALMDGGHVDYFIALVCEGYNNPSISKSNLEAQISALNAMHQKQHHYVNALKQSGSADIWSNYLSGVNVENALSYTKSNRDHIGIKEFTIPATEIDRLIGGLSTSVFNALLLSWGALVSKYCASDSSYINYPVKIKTDEEMLFGSEINVNIAKFCYQACGTFKTIVTKHQQMLAILVNDTNKHTYLPIADIVKASHIQRLNVGFAQTNLRTLAFGFRDCQAQSITKHYVDIAGHDILLEYQRLDSSYCFRLKYKSALFSDQQMDAAIAHYKKFLSDLWQYPNKPICEISLLDAKEYQNIVYDWNKTDKAFTKDKTIHQLFEAQAAKTPDNIAVVFEGQELSYRQLNAKSNQLARVIRSRYLNKTGSTLKPYTLVVLCLERSFEMICSILAVLKAGGAYVPIDPEFPKERIQYILQDTGTKIVLTQSQLIDNLNQLLQETSCIAVDQYDFNNSKSSNLPPYSKPSDLAYVIYTSGTTGQPKGVCLPHQGVVNRIEWMQTEYLLNLNDRVLQKTPFIFDVSVWELLWANCYGAAIVLARPGGHKDSDYLCDLIEKEKITLIHFVPSMLDVFLENLSVSNRYLSSSLRYIFCSGEALKETTVNNCYGLTKHHRFALHNLYGPTEASIDVTYAPCYKNNKVSIGRAIQNTYIYVLDAQLSPMPIGVMGELYIGGAGLARGYLNQPVLTQEKFITNPFASNQAIKHGYTRLYKTGDLGRFLPDGNIEYMGRNDFQVKLNGIRIEIGEIESALNQIKGIKQSVVIADKRKIKNRQETFLIAYYIASSELTETVIKDQLSKTLPSYMIPAYFMRLEKLPLTLSGKIDRLALPKVGFSLADAACIPPANDVEVKLCEIYSALFNVPSGKIGIEDGFFSWGGSSIIAIEMVMQIKQIFNKEITVADIFKHQTIKSIANNIIKKKDRAGVIEKHKTKQAVLSLEQQALWFIEESKGSGSAYHIPMQFILAGNIVLEALEKALAYVVRRHEVLRSVINVDLSGKYEQHPIFTALSIKNHHCKNNSDYKRKLKKFINTPFDLYQSFPISVGLFSMTGVPKYYLLVNFHHIAFDGWSIRIFLHELEVAYLAYSGKKKPSLPALPFQYKDYALWQQKYLSSHLFKEKLDDWCDQLVGFESLNLVTDRPRAATIDYQGDNLYFKFNQALSNQLRQLASSQGVSFYTLLLSAFYILLHKYSSQNDIVIGTPMANRQFNEFRETIGCFVNSVALRHQIEEGCSLKDFILQISHLVITAQAHQDVPFEQVVKKLNIKPCANIHPIFQVFFSVQDFESRKTDFPLWQWSIAHDDLAIAKFDLSLFIDDAQQHLQGYINYASALFEKDTIQSMCHHYQCILECLVESTATVIAEISLLNSKGYQKIVYDWNKTDKAFKQTTKHGYTRLYKTGDLGRFLPDGNIEYMGRNAFPGIADHKPQADLVQKLCQLYAEVLAIDIDKIAIDASFFDLGGSSLLIMQLKHRLMAIPECKALTVTDLFTYPSIKALTDYLQKTKATDYQGNFYKAVNRKEDIAIIAISGAFSGCDNLRQFWQIISQKISGLTRFDIDYCRKKGVAEEALNDPDYIPVSGHISNIDCFDPAFWGVSVHDAKLLDPQIRKFVEHCWYVLDNAGYTQERKHFKIDVVAGSGSSHYLYDNISHSQEADQLNLWEVSIANSKDALATKASYFLGLKGASTSINTACSTGLVTIVEACRKLADGLCDMAIAGSVSLLLPHQIGYVYRQGMIMSKDGHCRTFDANASGTVSGSGVGAVLLKRLSDAEKDKDNIIGVIQGYATNNDGDRKVSYTAPSTQGQSECIEQAIRMAGVSSEMLDYIECHGTATDLGDPIEIKALDNAFKNTATVKRTLPCYLGAVKANIGHTDSAAGFAGFAKVCLMLQHKEIPAQADYDRPNPEIGIKNTSFEINRQNCHWEASDQKPRYAGVSSFGIGGTNAHIILREYQPAMANHETKEDKGSNYILPLSAKSHQALEDYKTAFIVYFSETKAPLKDIIYTLQTRKSFFNHRLGVVCNNKTQAIKKLECAKIINSHITINSPIKKVFMFPGQGAQYSDMTVSLYQQDSAYRDYVNQCIALIEGYRYQSMDFKQILFPSLYDKVLKDQNDNPLIHQTMWSQLALFVISFSLAKLLEKMGIKPDIYIGHSIGEYVAATLSGIFTLEDAIKLIFKRGTLMQSMPIGAMLSVQAPTDKIMSFAKEYQCEVAVINSPNHCVLSGKILSITALKTWFDHKNIASVILKTSHAYHSKLMALAATQYIHSIASVKLHQPTIPFISNVSGDWAEKSALDPIYWSDHIRQPVKFSQGIETILHQEPSALFIEIGPGKSLSNFVSQHKNRYQQSPKTIDLIPSAKVAAEGQYTPSTQTDLLGRLWCLGYPVEFNTIENADIAVLPPYQFDYQSCWIKHSEPYNRKTQALTLLPQKHWLNKIIWKQFGKLQKIFPNTLESKRALVIVTDTTPEFLLHLSFKSTVILRLTDAVEGFRVVNKYQLLSNIASEKAYEALSQYLQAREIDCIIDCTTLTQECCFTSDLLNQCLENGFYTLFLVQKYLLYQCSVQYYFLLTQGIAQIEKADRIHPANGSLIGAIRVLRHEMPQIQFLMIDIGYDQAVNLDGVINNTFSGNINPSSYPYALRGDGLWVESIETIQDSSSQDQHLIECHDVILITGGLGGMGLSVAYYISQKNKVNFIFTSRTSTLSAKHSQIIKQIRDNQCTVEIQSGDVSNKEFIHALIFNIEKKHQKLSGVIHLAGSPPLRPQDKSIENVKQAVAAKIYGVSYILEFIDKENLRYFIMASSLASIMGDVHRIEYCAANSYLDYQARLMNDILPFCQSLSINWLGWKEVGMAVAEKPTLQQDKLIDLNSVTPEEGSKLFYDLIKPSVYNQVAISKFNIEKLKEKFFHKKNNDRKTTDISDKLLEKNLSKECYDITRLCLSVLEVNQISIYDNLFDLGLSSLDVIRLLSALKAIGVFVSIQQLFELNSINKIYCHHLSSTNKQNNTIQEQNSLLQRSLLLLRKSSKAIVNIFFIHPVGGILTIYNSLIGQLSKHYNYYGIQNINLYNQQKLNFKSFEALSDYYFNEILKIQDAGEYILIGSSLGGALAYEIARQLEKSGRKVKFIAMIDTWAYFAKVFYSRANFESNIYAQIKSQAIFGVLSGIDKEVFMDEGWKIMQLNLSYQPKNSHIPICLYKAITLDKYYVHNGVCADNGWQQYTSCKMKIYHIPGDHVSIHDNASLGIIAKHLNQALDSVDNKQELLLV